MELNNALLLGIIRLLNYCQEQRSFILKARKMFTKLYHGNCLHVVASLDMEVDAIVTDPPYGAKNNCDYTRFTGGVHSKHKYDAIEEDNKPFDPAPWLEFPMTLLWGYQFFASQVPLGTILVWNKRRDSKLGKMLSDCELAWFKGGKGVYLFNHVWDGFDRESERGKSLHPSQKPVALMKWCLEKLKLKPNATVLDPYMGTGPIGIACVELGYNYIGIEKVESYFDIATERINNAVREHENLCRPIRIP